MRLQIVFVNYILPSAVSMSYTLWTFSEFAQFAVPYLLQPPSIVAAYIKTINIH